MIEKFLDKFLPQITERLNENEEVGKALIEALAVLDNYATINNVQFTDEQVNSMLGILPEPEPEPEPNADIPAEIITAQENAWNWRFKTLDEFVDEYGDAWVDEVDWLGTGEMDYLLGEEIAETTESKEVIEELTARKSSKVINTFDVLRITSGGDDVWRINTDMLTNKPLPTAAKTPAKRGRKPKAAAQPTTWNWRFKTEKELKEEYGDDYWYDTNWSASDDMDYLFGQEIAETANSRALISLLQKGINREINTFDELGITSGRDDEWALQIEMLTQKPLPPAKRGRKPKAAATAQPTTWNYRFKTEQEFIDYFGDDWRITANWSAVNKNMDYLLGQRIVDTPKSRKFIENFEKRGSQLIDTKKILGITSGVDDEWSINELMLIQEPLPTAAATAQSTTWTWRYKTEEEFERDYGKNWRGSFWTSGNEKDYLFGQPIVETEMSRKVIEKNVAGNYYIEQLLGIKAPVGKDDYFGFTPEMEITQDPLPTISQSKSKPAKRGRKPKSELPEIDLGGLEDIGDIDVDDIDFDNLVI